MKKVIDRLPERVIKVIDNLLRKEFNQLDREKFLRDFYKFSTGISIDWDSLSQREIYQKIRKIMLVELLSGSLKKFDPTETEIFDDAVKRRNFFGKLSH